MRCAPPRGRHSYLVAFKVRRVKFMNKINCKFVGCTVPRTISRYPRSSTSKVLYISKIEILHSQRIFSISRPSGNFVIIFPAFCCVTKNHRNKNSSGWRLRTIIEYSGLIRYIRHPPTNVGVRFDQKNDRSIGVLNPRNNNTLLRL